MVQLKQRFLSFEDYLAYEMGQTTCMSCLTENWLRCPLEYKGGSRPVYR